MLALYSWLELGPQQKNISFFCLASGKQREPQKNGKRGAISEDVLRKGSAFATEYRFSEDRFPRAGEGSLWALWDACAGLDP